MQQTISGEFSLILSYDKIIFLLGTLYISYFYTVKVKTLLFFDNPQVTNASNSLVGTSEAIRLLNMGMSKRLIHKLSSSEKDFKFKQ